MESWPVKYAEECKEASGADQLTQGGVLSGQHPATAGFRASATLAGLWKYLSAW